VATCYCGLSSCHKGAFHDHYHEPSLLDWRAYSDKDRKSKGNAAAGMTMKRRDEETGARYPTTYTTGKAKAVTIRKLCTRSCVACQGT
jgi:hypothetical protein